MGCVIRGHCEQLSSLSWMSSHYSSLSGSPHRQNLHTPLCQNAAFRSSISQPAAEEGAFLQLVSKELKGCGGIRRSMRFIASQSTCGIDWEKPQRFPLLPKHCLFLPSLSNMVSLICLSSRHDKCLLQLPVLGKANQTPRPVSMKTQHLFSIYIKWSPSKPEHISECSPNIISFVNCKRCCVAVQKFLF